MSKLPALTPDDPLRARPEAPSSGTATPPADSSTDEPSTATAAAPIRRRPTHRPAKTRQPSLPRETSTEQDWSGATDVTTLRLPVEVLHALHERSRQLGVAKGMTIAAALLELLRRDDRELVELIEQTQQRYDSARRRARRAA